MDVIEALRNPQIRKAVGVNFKKSLDPLNISESDKGLPGFMLTAINEGLYGLPGKNKFIKRKIDKYAKSNPYAALAGSVAGELGSGVLPGGLAVKGLARLGKLKKILKGTSVGSKALQGSIFGAGAAGTSSAAKGDKVSDVALNTLGGAGAGAVLGAGFNVGSKLLKGGGNAIANMIKSKKSVGRKIIKKVAQDMMSEMSSKDLKKMNDIITNPIKSKTLNLNTLLHRGSEANKSLTDALYMRSNKARELIEQTAKRFEQNQRPFLEEAISEVKPVGKGRSAKKYVEIITKLHSREAAPLYKKAYAGEKVGVPERIKNEPLFQKALKEEKSKLNKLDLKKPEFSDEKIHLLDLVKRNLQQNAAKSKANQLAHDENQLKSVQHALTAHLKDKSPAYKNAVETAEKYFKVAKAVEKGAAFRKSDVQDIKSTLKLLSQNPDNRELIGYKLGAIDSLQDEVNQSAAKFLSANQGKSLQNWETKRRLAALLNPEKNAQLSKKVDAAREAYENIGEYVKGSKTAKHLANEKLNEKGTAAVRAMKALMGNTRAIMGLTAKAINKIGQGNAEAKDKIMTKMLLRPKLLKHLGTKTKTPELFKKLFAGQNDVGMYIRDQSNEE